MIFAGCNVSFKPLGNILYLIGMQPGDHQHYLYRERKRCQDLQRLRNKRIPDQNVWEWVHSFFSDSNKTMRL